MRVNIVRPIYKRLTQINQYEVIYESRKNNIVTVEVAARNYATAKDLVEKGYKTKQIYSVCLIETDIWCNEEGCTYITWCEKKKRWF